ncbi:hypothetical protein L6452_02923 [Arctium lappa]|uniref:Uncharacterized protein n=1 Tax=Arctium lappa TaxID=4217 RepID=A0ACB9FLA6_ARCLA|nr:hypothetical protein L6452_02923 [Arctium lappa]
MQVRKPEVLVGEDKAEAVNYGTTKIMAGTIILEVQMTELIVKEGHTQVVNIPLEVEAEDEAVAINMNQLVMGNSFLLRQGMLNLVFRVSVAAAPIVIYSLRYKSISCANPEEAALIYHEIGVSSTAVKTGTGIEGGDCHMLKVALIDAHTRKTVSNGIESSTKVEIVVLEGDFDDDIIQAGRGTVDSGWEHRLWVLVMESEKQSQSLYKAERLLADAPVGCLSRSICGYPRGSNFGVSIGKRTLKGKEDFRKYHDAAINVPGKMNLNRMPDCRAASALIKFEAVIGLGLQIHLKTKIRIGGVDCNKCGSVLGAFFQNSYSGVKVVPTKSAN